jgi:hypothetical protein
LIGSFDDRLRDLVSSDFYAAHTATHAGHLIAHTWHLLAIKFLQF